MPLMNRGVLAGSATKSKAASIEASMVTVTVALPI
jgi:hypothetical protein